MIVFEFDIETHNNDGTAQERAIYWLGSTSCTNEDEEHCDEIYEQLDANQVFNV